MRGPNSHGAGIDYGLDIEKSRFRTIITEPGDRCEETLSN